MLEEGKYSSDAMNKHFKKELVMTEKDDKDFGKSTKSWICDNNYVQGDLKARNDCHITGKYLGSAHRDCNFKVKLNHKILIAFHYLKNYIAHLTMQGSGKFDFKINIIPNRLEKYMSFNINNKQLFIGGIQFTSSSLHSLVKIMDEYDFKYLS